MTDTIAILQAQTSSRRLPCRALQLIAGEPLLQRVIERVQLAFKIDRLVVATSTRASDHPVAAIARRMNVDCLRSDSEAPLERSLQAARHYGARHIVSMRDDSVLIDSQLIDRVVAQYHHGGYACCGNNSEPTFPKGLEVEVCSVEALEAACLETNDRPQGQTVSSLLSHNPLRFPQGVFKDSVDRSGMRWCVEEPEDLEFVQRVFEKLYPYGPAFSREDVFELLEQSPELAQINARCGAQEDHGIERLAA